MFYPVVIVFAASVVFGILAWFKKTAFRVTVGLAGGKRRIVSGPADPRPAGSPISPPGVSQFLEKRW